MQEQLPRGAAHFSNTKVFEKCSKAKTSLLLCEPKKTMGEAE